MSFTRTFVAPAVVSGSHRRDYFYRKQYREPSITYTHLKTSQDTWKKPVQLTQGRVFTDLTNAKIMVSTQTYVNLVPRFNQIASATLFVVKCDNYDSENLIIDE